MGLVRRVSLAGSVAVGVGVAVATGSLVLAWVFQAGVVAASLGAGFGAVVGVASAHWGARLATRSVVGRLDELTVETRRLGVDSERVPELGDYDGARLGAAINEAATRYQARLTETEADVRLLASLVERSPNGVLICRNDGRIRNINQAFRDLFEVRGDPVGKLPTEVIAAPEVQELVDLARQGGADDEVRLVPGVRTVVLRPIVTDGGEVGVLAQDISAYKAAERARTDFVANVSHELRTPMAAILGYAETLGLEQGRLPADVLPLVEAISRNSRRLSDTFEGLMHLAQVEARLGELTLETLRLEPLLVEAVVAAVDQASAKGLDFELHCPQELTARTNAAALDVIIRNLVTNAVKYTPAGGQVRVVVEPAAPGEVRVDIVDTGIGIDAAHQARVFERFFRVDEGRAREVGGTGLGLAMVRHLALATGARVTLESKVGQGSTFSLYLPSPGPAA